MKTQRYSRQRELIYRALCETKEHPTAETLYQWLKPECPHLSLGTVYRNLSRLIEDGLIQRLPFSVDRFDAIVCRHAHFHCKRCGAVYDLELDYQHALDAKARCSGHEIHDHEMVFHGICAECTLKPDEEDMEVSKWN